MSITLPTSEPTTFRAGLTVAWEKSNFSNYSYENGYTIAKYTINGKNGTETITGSYASGTWTFTLTASRSAALAAGTYKLYGYVETADASDRQQVYEGELTIQESFVTASQTDTRTHIKKMLDALEAMLEKRATYTQSQTQLPNGVTLALLKPEELIKWYEHYKFLYFDEADTQRVKNGGARKKILTTFLPTS